MCKSKQPQSAAGCAVRLVISMPSANGIVFESITARKPMHVREQKLKPTGRSRQRTKVRRAVAGSAPAINGRGHLDNGQKKRPRLPRPQQATGATTAGPDSGAENSDRPASDESDRDSDSDDRQDDSDSDDDAVGAAIAAKMRACAKALEEDGVGDTDMHTDDGGDGDDTRTRQENLAILLAAGRTSNEVLRVVKRWGCSRDDALELMATVEAAQNSGAVLRAVTQQAQAEAEPVGAV